MSQKNDSAVKECINLEAEELSQMEVETQSVSDDDDVQIIGEVRRERNSSFQGNSEGVIRYTGNLEVGKRVENDRTEESKTESDTDNEGGIRGILELEMAKKKEEGVLEISLHDTDPCYSASSTSDPGLTDRNRKIHHECEGRGHLVITNVDAAGTSKSKPSFVFQPAEAPFCTPKFSTGFNVVKRKGDGDEETDGEKLPIKRTEIELEDHRGGIEWSNNSCYLDVTLFSMFFGTNVFDSRCFELKQCQDPGDWVSVRTVYALKRIASFLRNDGFCPSHETTRLRDVISEINPKLKSAMMDVDEFLQTLLGRALKLRPFINYNVKSNNFIHQIVTDPNEPVHFEVKDMLAKSMEIQNLKFSAIPVPALILKMPVSDGVPAFASALPNLVMDIGNLMDKPDENNPEIYKMFLMAVIALKNKHFTTYVREFTTESPHVSYADENWVFFDSLRCKVTSQEWFTSFLRSTERKCERKFDKKHDETRKMLEMMKNCYICIYFSPHAVETESRYDAPSFETKTFDGIFQD